MKYIDNEIILQRKIGSMVYVYIMIIIVIMLSLIIVCILCHYKTYYCVRGVVIEENNNFYIRVYIPIENIKYTTNNDIVMIDGKEFKYKIISIDSEYFTDNITTYQIIKMEVNIKDKHKYNNLTIDLKFLKDEKRVIDYILK